MKYPPTHYIMTIIKQKAQDNPRTGFENLGFTVHPDCSSTLAIPFVGGKYVLNLTPEKQEYFENNLGVKFDSPEGIKFLDNFSIEIDHTDCIIGDTPIDQFKKHLLTTSNGFGLVKTGEVTGPVDTTIFEFFDEEENTNKRVSKKQLLNEAIASLQDLWTNKRSQITLFAQYLLEINSGITNEIIAYDKLTDYITQEANASRFLRALKEDVEHIDLVVTIKQAVAVAVIRSVNGKYQNPVTNTGYGRTIEEVVSFFSNPANQDELGTGAANDEAYTIKAQLRNSLRV